jgi:hypothetical protein
MEPIQLMTFDEVWKRGVWVPIRDCPGRFVLHGRPPSFSLAELFGHEPEILRFPTPAARDCVLVVRLEDGGVITYQRADGSFLHTLATAEGLGRKLTQLGSHF